MIETKDSVPIHLEHLAKFPEQSFFLQEQTDALFVLAAGTPCSHSQTALTPSLLPPTETWKGREASRYRGFLVTKATVCSLRTQNVVPPGSGKHQRPSVSLAHPDLSLSLVAVSVLVLPCLQVKIHTPLQLFISCISPIMLQKLENFAHWH